MIRYKFVRENACQFVKFTQDPHIHGRHINVYRLRFANFMSWFILPCAFKLTVVKRDSGKFSFGISNRCKIVYGEIATKKNINQFSAENRNVVFRWNCHETTHLFIENFSQFFFKFLFSGKNSFSLSFYLFGTVWISLQQYGGRKPGTTERPLAYFHGNRC